MGSQPVHIRSGGRPGCVTAYAVILGISASLLIIVTLSRIGESLISPVGVVGVAASEILLAWGLWRMKNWARIIVIVLHGLGILINLVSICLFLFFFFSAHTNPDPFLSFFFSIYATFAGVGACGAIVGIPIGGYIAHWFDSHAEYFS